MKVVCATFLISFSLISADERFKVTLETNLLPQMSSVPLSGCLFGWCHSLRTPPLIQSTNTIVSLVAAVFYLSPPQITPCFCQHPHSDEGY